MKQLQHTALFLNICCLLLFCKCKITQKMIGRNLININLVSKIEVIRIVEMNLRIIYYL